MPTSDQLDLPRPIPNSAPLSAPGEAVLDNPIWNALGTEHKSIALGDDRARRYPPAIGPLSGLPNGSAESYEALRILAGAEGLLGLFCQDEPKPPAGWTTVRGGLLAQMVSSSTDVASSGPIPVDATLRRLDHGDVPAMMALAELTEPGPFRERTIELGDFFGIFMGERLMAMSGQRLNLPGYTEVSAVCTHPDARGRGYARILMSRVMDEIRRRGKVPFLHSFADNYPAIRVYESLGFTLRRHLHLAVLKNEA